VIVLGLTGSIGMGKSTAAKMLRLLGLPLHDADAAVHDLLGPGGAAVTAVAAAFPTVVVAGQVDRQRLGAMVFQDPVALSKLEALLHPRVRQMACDFLRVQTRQKRRSVVLDIPLLFETGGDQLCDVVIVVTAPRFLQEARVLSRPGMTVERLRAIRGHQMPDREKCRRADFVVQTGLAKGYTLRQLAAIIKAVQGRGSTRLE
jgi:dephospho-CoA kinase